VPALRQRTTTHCRKEKTKFLEKFGWENLDHAPSSADLAPSDFHIFPKMEEFLGGKQMAPDEGAKETVTDWLNGLAADFYVEGFVRIVQRLHKSQWNYVEN
jgi:hypothetical protein